MLGHKKAGVEIISLLYCPAYMVDPIFPFRIGKLVKPTGPNKRIPIKLIVFTK